ncbi:MAG: tetratricopeptide repeat protein [Pseudoflavonifractor sp.]|nr:tetratricopeptide repeat protein [Pseudoflavonifractor sp.]
MRKLPLILLTTVITALTMLSCSTRKNTATSRAYQAFTTRYNVYFNGDEHYKETLKEMEKNYEDDYSRTLIFMHPAEAKADPKATQPTGDFTRSIEKAQKAIQLHSIKKRPKKKSGRSNDPKYRAWLKRDEYNPFLHNAWMMMGRSQFNNGDFLGAASTFYYTSRHFNWLPATVTEAELWQARSYIAMGWNYEAENILRRVKDDELTSGTLRGLYNYVYGDLYVHTKEYDKAVPYLVEARRYAKGTQKTRISFLLGQVYSLLGRKQEAYQAFGKAAGASGAPYRTQFNARIRQSEVYQGENIEPEVKALRRMARYSRNKEYLDQIYYAIGNLYLSRRDTTRAIENYELAVEKSTRNNVDKAIAQITLGGLYFDQHRYDKAQPCYSEAVPMLPDTYPGYEQLRRRSDVLDELAVYSQNVTLQDSLLRLSAMTPEEQLAVVNKIIDDLKKKEKEEAERARKEEYLAQQDAAGNGLQDNNAPTTFTLNTDDSWYFYNNATRNAGRTDFQKRWGSRRLEDDWRRRNKSSFDLNDFEESSEEDEEDTENPDGPDSGDTAGDETKDKAEDKDLAKKESDPHYPEYYLKQIPKTDLEKLTSNDVIQEGLYNMGLILKDKLEDYTSANDEWQQLLTRYPDNIYRLEVYYNLYLMYMRMGQTAMAEKYRQLILNDFADSKYGMAMRDPHYLDNLKEMDTEQERMYERAYEAYLDNRNDAVHAAYDEMMHKYPLSKIMPKFMFIDALTYVTENNPGKFRSTLKELLERYPETDITPLASAYLSGLAKGRKLNSGSGANLRGMIWDMRLGNDSTATAASDSIIFDLNPADPQLLVLAFPTDSVSSNKLLFDIARHNFTSYVVKDFDLEQMNFGRLGMLIVKGFANLDELTHYRKVLAADNSLKIPAQVRPVMISAKNFELLLQQGRSLEEYFRFVNESNAADAVKAAIPDEIYDSLPEEEAGDGELPDIALPAAVPTTTPQPSDETATPAVPEAQPEKPVDEPKSEGDKPEQPTRPAVAPEQPAKPEQPTAQPEQAVKPTQPTTKPTQPTVPAVKNTPLPYYPQGSEGDDDEDPMD